MITTEVLSVGPGALMVKRADPTSAAETARLGREATMLAVARHPGVVELAPGTGEAELRTVFVGARTMADPAPLDVGLDALTATAATIADLHGLGIVHGRIDAGHVVLTGSGRAVICGFAEAGLAGDRRSDGLVLRPSVDVAALGALLDHLLVRSDANARGNRRRSDCVALTRLASRATADDVTLRPSARAFAVALDAARPRRSGPRADPTAPPAPTPKAVNPNTVSPDAVNPTRTTEVGSTGPKPSPAIPAGRMILVIVGGLMVACTSIGLGIRALREPSDPPYRELGADDHATSGADRPEQHSARPGGEVTIDDQRYSLGTAADQVLVAVWGCAGRAGPVLVRPDGAVFRFAELATAERPVRGVATGQLPPGAAARLVPDADGCIQVQAGTGSEVVTIAIPTTPSPTTPR